MAERSSGSVNMSPFNLEVVSVFTGKMLRKVFFLIKRSTFNCDKGRYEAEHKHAASSYCQASQTVPTEVDLYQFTDSAAQLESH